jgi:hypothetical protein
MTISLNPLGRPINLQFGNQEQNPSTPHVEFPLDEEGKDMFIMSSRRDTLSPEELSSIKTADGRSADQLLALKPGQRVYYLNETAIPNWILADEDAETATHEIMKDKISELSHPIPEGVEVRKRGFNPVPILFIPKPGSQGGGTGIEIPIETLYSSEESFRSALKQRVEVLQELRRSKGPMEYGRDSIYGTIWEEMEKILAEKQSQQ